MIFFGKYVEVIADQRLVWTNEESADGAVTTVTFEGINDQTLLVFREVHPTKEALDHAFDGMDACMPEQLNQLDQLLADQVH